MHVALFCLICAVSFYVLFTHNLIVFFYKKKKEAWILGLIGVTELGLKVQARILTIIVITRGLLIQSNPILEVGTL